MNALRRGNRSRLYRELQNAMFSVAPGQFDAEEFAALTPQDAGNPSYARLIEDYLVATDPLAASRVQVWPDSPKPAKVAGVFNLFSVIRKNNSLKKKGTSETYKPFGLNEAVETFGGYSTGKCIPPMRKIDKLPKLKGLKRKEKC